MKIVRKIIRIILVFANLLGNLKFKNKFLRFDVNVSLGSLRLDLRDSNNLEFSVGQDSMLNCKFIFERPGATISVGERTYIGDSTSIIASKEVSIGNDVLISWGVTIVDHNAHSIYWNYRKDDVLMYSCGKKDWSFVDANSISIGDRCWIGFNSIILKGVRLGPECVVAAGSVVTKSFPMGSVIGGNPAVLLKTLVVEEFEKNQFSKKNL